jgi:hypothetical protein
MNKRIVWTLAFAAVGGHAQVHRDPTPQQQLQTTCNYEAGARELQGEEHRKFVNACMAQGRERQQQVLNTCRLESRAKQALERRAFMEECIRR